MTPSDSTPTSRKTSASLRPPAIRGLSIDATALAPTGPHQIGFLWDRPERRLWLVIDRDEHEAAIPEVLQFASAITRVIWYDDATIELSRGVGRGAQKEL